MQASLGMMRLRELSSALDNDEYTFQTFFNLSPDLLAVLSVDELLMRINPSWQKLLGWSEEAVLGTPLSDLVHQDDHDIVLEAYKRLEYGDLNGFVCRIRHTEGYYLAVEFSATRWYGGYSNLIGRLVLNAETSLKSPRRVLNANPDQIKPG